MPTRNYFALPLNCLVGLFVFCCHHQSLSSPDFLSATRSRLKAALIKAATTKRKQLVWYVAPTYRMARGIMWQELQDSIPKHLIKRINETLLIIWLVNGSRIELSFQAEPAPVAVGFHSSGAPFGMKIGM